MLHEGVFPEDWKKSNVAIHIKESKSLIKKYCHGNIF